MGWSTCEAIRSTSTSGPSSATKGWGWDDVLPYFRKSERNERGASDLAGGEGPMSVSDPVQRHPVTDDFLRSAVRVGIPKSAG